VQGINDRHFVLYNLCHDFRQRYLCTCNPDNSSRLWGSARSGDAGSHAVCTWLFDRVCLISSCCLLPRPFAHVLIDLLFTFYRPVLWGPLSEIKGRRLPLVVAACGTAIFHFAVAVSKDLQSILINRFFAGFFGTSPLAVAGAVFVDMFDNKTRGIAVRLFPTLQLSGVTKMA
jgi:MFS family permease